MYTYISTNLNISLEKLYFTTLKVMVIKLPKAN